MKYLRNLFRNMDKISPEPSSRLHYGSGDAGKHKTYFGACCTLVAYFLFMGFFMHQFRLIYDREHPNVSS